MNAQVLNTWNNSWFAEDVESLSVEDSLFKFNEEYGHPDRENILQSLCSLKHIKFDVHDIRLTVKRLHKLYLKELHRYRQLKKKSQPGVLKVGYEQVRRVL